MLRIFSLRESVQLRFYSIKRATKEPTRYTNTINLPRTKFPARLGVAKRTEIEEELNEAVTTACYRYQLEHNRDPTFILHDGPPYANGDLHMGHAVNKILKDITIRNRVIRGQKINFIPGWDCHGLPIELKALEAQSQANKSVTDIEVLSIRRASREFATKAIDHQKKEFQKWAILGDWLAKDGVYYTFSKEFISKQLRLFWTLYNQGLIYRDLKPVYWSPSSGTALAEAELEYDEMFISPSLYLRLRLTSLPPSIANSLTTSEDVYALVWTTTPWTLLSNQAVCFNAKFLYTLVRFKSDQKLYLIAKDLLEEFQKNTNIEYEIVQDILGNDLLHCKYQQPLIAEESQLPFIDAAHVQSTKGTGLVHTAPAHGPDDFLICLNKNIPIKCFVSNDGTFNSDAPIYLQGKSVLKEGNAAILEYLKDSVVYVGSIIHSYPIDWRTKKPVIIKASQQWFINTSNLKNNAIKEIDKINVYPRINAESNKNALMAQVMRRPYWCISRQRAWGVPIPVFYEKLTGKVITNKKLIEHICNRLGKEGNMDFWWSSEKIEDLIPKNILEQFQLSAKDLIKGLDIFDIWFDSGCTWSQLLKNDSDKIDLYLEGYDQFTGWFQSSLLTSVAARNCSPYKGIFVHGFTVDKNGNKMSKSLGNVILPKTITTKHGTDVLRWWVAAHGTQHMAITVGNSVLQQSEDSLHKIRTVLRYLNGVIQEKKKDVTPENCLQNYKSLYLNRYLLSKLVDFESEIFALYDRYEYNRVIALIQNFITNTISAVYIHLIKDRLYCGKNDDIAQIRDTIEKCYIILNKVLWPITPLLIEESWSHYDNSTRFYEHNFKTDPSWKDRNIEKSIDTALEVKRLINQRQPSRKNTWYLTIKISCYDEKDLKYLNMLHPDFDKYLFDTELCEILQVNSIWLSSTLLRRMKKSCDDDNGFNIYIDDNTFNLCHRCRRFALLDTDEGICIRCSKVLEAINK